MISPMVMNFCDALPRRRGLECSIKTSLKHKAPRLRGLDGMGILSLDTPGAVAAGQLFHLGYSDPIEIALYAVLQR